VTSPAQRWAGKAKGARRKQKRRLKTLGGRSLSAGELRRILKRDP
jgi:hypothetical protein